MALIYRLEYNGQGIYAGCGWWSSNLSTEDLTFQDHPTLGEDAGLLNAYQESETFQKGYKDVGIHGRVYTQAKDEVCLFGFESIDQLLDWMHKPEWRHTMRKTGVTLVTYEVPAEWVLFGSKQTVFKAAEAVEVRKEVFPEWLV